jgi:integral membrane protein
MSSSQVSSKVAAPARAPVGRGVLVAYQIMAYLTAVLLLVLVFVAIPLQIWAHSETLVAIVGQLHGFLYIVYVIVAFVLTVRLRVPLVRMVLVLLAGTIPFGAFFAERSMRHRWEANHAAAEPAAPAAPAVVSE